MYVYYCGARWTVMSCTCTKPGARGEKMQCTGPTGKTVLTCHPTSSAQNRPSRHPDLKASRNRTPPDFAILCTEEKAVCLKKQQ